MEQSSWLLSPPGWQVTHVLFHLARFYANVCADISAIWSPWGITQWSVQSKNFFLTDLCGWVNRLLLFMYPNLIVWCQFGFPMLKWHCAGCSNAWNTLTRHSRAMNASWTVSWIASFDMGTSIWLDTLRSGCMNMYCWLKPAPSIIGWSLQVLKLPREWQKCLRFSRPNQTVKMIKNPFCLYTCGIPCTSVYLTCQQQTNTWLWWIVAPTGWIVVPAKISLQFLTLKYNHFRHLMAICQKHTSICIITMSITVRPIWKDYPWCQDKVVFPDRGSFQTGCNWS